MYRLVSGFGVRILKSQTSHDKAHTKSCNEYKKDKIKLQIDKSDSKVAIGASKEKIQKTYI